MKILKGQIIASTHKDAQGDKIPKFQLLNIFEQMSDVMMLSQYHDLGKPPIGKMYNKRFVETPDGEFAIKVDIEIYDEEVFSKMGGISISVVTECYTINPTGKPAIEILFNPLIFDKEDIIPIVKLTSDTIQIDAHELKQKGLENLPILILKFAAISTVAGFFGKLGADIYDKIKNKIRFIRNKKDAQHKHDLRIQLLIRADLFENPVDIILDLMPEDLEIVMNSDASLESAINYITRTTKTDDIQLIALRFNKNEPYWSIIYFIDLQGEIVIK